MKDKVGANYAYDHDDPDGVSGQGSSVGMNGHVIICLLKGMNAKLPSVLPIGTSCGKNKMIVTRHEYWDKGTAVKSRWNRDGAFSEDNGRLDPACGASTRSDARSIEECCNRTIAGWG